MDIVLRIDLLVPAADYSGIPRDQVTFDNLVWRDDRDKPTWDQILTLDLEEASYLDKAAAAEELQQSDADMARITEDLVDILIAKGVLSTDDFHASVTEKLNQRKANRAKVQ